VGEAAKLLNQSHVFISTTAKQMIEAGLLQKNKSQKDSRISKLSLSEKGIDLAKELTPVWQDIQSCLLEIGEFAGIDLDHFLNQMEQTIKENDLYSLIKKSQEKRKLENIEIIDYNNSYQNEFYKIGKSWIESMFFMEDSDLKILTNPKKYILDDGGKILLARYKNEILGTCALIKLKNRRYELTKMGVLPKAKGLKIGKKLMVASIQKCRNLNAKSIYLETSYKCEEAIALYRKFGFKNVAIQSDCKYERCELAMELIL
ncbi:bifunctional helix-turn-helix transcriptional regulator/GNAT family N-acetyltransferase, partial [bacterium]|nr:bifunctional helix-turn-helix transcriptional regulator/GNAT family N-acetyltransferase [bacterium]